MNRKTWYERGLRFECTRCGNCCRNHGDYAYVYLNEHDVSAIAGHLGLDRARFLSVHCEEVDGFTVLRLGEPQCQFLEPGGGCSIYPVRPKQCATWPFWTDNLVRETWEGPVRDCCPGIGRGPLYSKAEIEWLAHETDAWYGDPSRDPGHDSGHDPGGER